MNRDTGGDATPRARSPAAVALHNLTHAHDRSMEMNEHELNQEEARIVADALAGRTPRTSYYAGSLEEGMANHFHDIELCVLLHQESDPGAHEFVKKALRKAVRQRVKKLGMKYDNEVGVLSFRFSRGFESIDIVLFLHGQSIRQYKKSYHDHDPSVHLRPDYSPADVSRPSVTMPHLY